MKRYGCVVLVKMKTRVYTILLYCVSVFCVFDVCYIVYSDHCTSQQPCEMLRLKQSTDKLQLELDESMHSRQHAPISAGYC